MTTIESAFEKEWPMYAPAIAVAGAAGCQGPLKTVAQALFAKAFVAGFDHCQSTYRAAVKDIIQPAQLAAESSNAEKGEGARQ